MAKGLWKASLGTYLYRLARLVVLRALLPKAPLTATRPYSGLYVGPGICPPFLPFFSSTDNSTTFNLPTFLRSLRQVVRVFALSKRTKEL
jgi:hypothetical protein